MNANAMVQDPMALIDEVESGIKAEVIKTDPVEMAKVHIEGFTKEDFEGKAPYMYVLMNHGGMKSDYATLKAKLLEQAHIVKYGRRNAQTKMTAYEEENPDLVPKLKAVVSINSCEGFTGVEKFFGDNPVDYGGYNCSDSGIIGTLPDGRPVMVCRHPIIISKRYVNKDDPEHQRETVDVSFFQNGHWKTLPQVPLADIKNAATIVKVLAPYRISVTSSTAANMVNYLDAFDFANSESGTIPEVVATGKIGWYGNGFETFVPYTNEVFYDGSIPGTRSMYQAIHSEGSFDEWMETVKPILDPKDPRNIPNKIMVEGGGFGSVLVRLLGKNCFWINLNSDSSGSGKSVVLMAAASVWGNPFIGEDGYVLAMSGTVNGLEERAHFCNNLPLCLDEIQTMQDCADWKPLLYRLCQGKGKNRAGRGGGNQYDRYWRLIILSTGEMNIVHDDAHEGEINRIVDLFVNGDLMDKPELVADSLQVNNGFAGKKFIEALKAEKIENIRKRFYELRSAFMANQRTKKQADAGAMIVLGSELANKYVLHGTPLTVEQVQEYLATNEQVDINRRAYELFQDWVIENNECFITKGNQYPKRVFGKIMDDGKVRILPSIFRSEFLQSHQFSYQAFTGWCVRKGIVTKDEKSARLGIDTRLGSVEKKPCLEFDLNKGIDAVTPPKPIVDPEPEQQTMKIDEQSGCEVVHDDDLPF